MNRTQPDDRPDPDALLKEIQKEERRQGGTLKLFLGYSPGVGKTYSMLLEAHVLKRRGVDVVVGLVETHGRSETEELLEGLEVIPRKRGEYRGIILGEMDLDALLARKPAVAVVDELAHTNAPWCRHPKRYLDVEELLAAGIDVHTTVNVQHLESQNDVVAKITGIRVQETVPDWVLDRAEEVQVIDIPLEKLFERLREGKVYIPEQARRAMESFFQRGHLVALREIMLNTVARKMDEELLNYRRAKAISGPWPAAGKLMVCIGGTPNASQLVRKAYRMAKERNVEWYAVHVAPPTLRELSPAKKSHLADAFNLAEEFGARTVTLSGIDVVPGLLRFAQENNISQIVIGKPRRSLLLGALRGYPVYRLLRDRGDFDLLLVTPTVAEGRAPAAAPVPAWCFDFRGYLLAIPAIALASGLNLLLNQYSNPISLYAVYLIATIVVALLFGTGPSVWAAVLSMLGFDFLFMAPRFSFAVARPADAVSALVFLVTSIIIGQLIRVTRRQSVALQIRAERISLLEEMSKELLVLPAIARLIGRFGGEPALGTERLEAMQGQAFDDIARITLRYLAKALTDPALVLLPGPSGRLEARAGPDDGLGLTKEEEAVAEWTFRHGEPAGAGTETLANVSFFFTPMKCQDQTLGVIGVRGRADAFLPEQRRLLGAIANLASLSAVRWTRPRSEAD